MKIQIISDCHLEHRRLYGPDYGLTFDSKADVLVVAGDLDSLPEGCRFLKRCNFKREIIYVPGNHEYYTHDIDEVFAEGQEICKHSRVHLLNNETVTKKDVRFICATLWTDYNIFNNDVVSARMSGLELNDHRMITIDGGQRLWKPTDALVRHKESRQFIVEELKKPFEGKTVVVTHHGPSLKSVESKYRNDPVTGAFVSNLEKMIRHFKPAAWIHGHTHNRINYQIDKTEVYCYPYGYPGELGIYHPLTIEV